MQQEESVFKLAHELGLNLKEDQFPVAKQLLIDHINNMVKNDFPQLIAILYRMDVSEQKLRAMLKENKEVDAGLLIAELMIERQDQKIKSRRQFRQRDNDINEEDKW